MKSTIVIPQKTNSEMTLSLVRQIHQFEPESEVIVIHDTQDDEMDELPNCRLIRNRGVGVTAAWNHGVEEASNELVILLNNDVVCTGPFVGRLYAGERCIGGVRQRVEGMIGAAANSLPGGPASLWLEGWCLSFLRSCWSMIGGFDESMSLYFSDLDFQVRAVGKDLSLVLCSGVPFRHLGHQTTRTMPSTRTLWNQDRAVFIRKLTGAV